MSEPSAFRFELVRGFGIESEEVEMVRNRDMGANGMSQPSRFGAVEVSGDASFRFVSVDWDQRYVHGEAPQGGNQIFVQERVAAMVNRQAGNFHDVTQETTMALFVSFDCIVRGSNPMKFDSSYITLLAGIDFHQACLDGTEST